MIHRTVSIELDPSKERLERLALLGFTVSISEDVKYDLEPGGYHYSGVDSRQARLVALHNNEIGTSRALFYALDNELVESFEYVIGDWKKHIGRDPRVLESLLHHELQHRLAILNDTQAQDLLDAAVSKYNRLVHSAMNDSKTSTIVYNATGKPSNCCGMYFSARDWMYLDNRLVDSTDHTRGLITASDSAVDIPVLKYSVQYQRASGSWRYYADGFAGCPVVRMLGIVLGYVAVENDADLVHTSNTHYYYTADEYQVYGSRNVYYSEVDGEYYYYECNMPEEEVDEGCTDYNFRYHDSNAGIQWHSSTHGTADEYLIGFEVEKEDYDLKHKYYAQELLDTTLYRKENDASLCDDSGYELISPVYKFDLNLIKDELSKHKDVLDLLSGGGSNSCGTHITLSKHSMYGSDIFERLVHWLPLLYALYPSRANDPNGGYSKPKYGKESHKYNERHGSIHVSSSKVEIRIFPVTRSAKQLLWRLELVRILLDLRVATMKGIRKYCKQGRLKAHLMKVYGDNESRIDNLLERAEGFAAKYQLT